MLYKFKSKAAGDLIMLEPNGRQVLQAIGKDAGPKGIIQPAEMGPAAAALERAVAEEEARARDADGHDKASGQAHRSDAVGLRQRAAPFIDMLRRCEKAGEDIVWGV